MGAEDVPRHRAGLGVGAAFPFWSYVPTGNKKLPQDLIRTMWPTLIAEEQPASRLYVPPHSHLHLKARPALPQEPICP